MTNSDRTVRDWLIDTVPQLRAYTSKQGYPRISGNIFDIYSLALQHSNERNEDISFIVYNDDIREFLIALPIAANKNVMVSIDTIDYCGEYLVTLCSDGDTYVEKLYLRDNRPLNFGEGAITYHPDDYSNDEVIAHCHSTHFGAYTLTEGILR